MNPNRTDRKLNGAAWRRRYRAAFSTLLHFKLTLQTLALPDDPVPEQLSEVDLDLFLRRMLTDLMRFTIREIRLLEATGGGLRRWRVAELLPLLELFDETAALGSSELPQGARAEWRRVSGALVRLKARIVQFHIYN